MRNIIEATKIVYERQLYRVITLILSVVSFAFFMSLLLSNTSWQGLWAMNNSLYNSIQIVTSIVTSLLFAVSISFLIFIVRQKREQNNFNIIQTVGAVLFSSLVTGCYVCGAVLLPTAGIAVSLASMPFGGLEIKILTIFILFWSLLEYSKSVLGICEVEKDSFINIKDNQLLIKPKLNLLLKYKPLYIIILLAVLFLLLPVVTDIFKLDFKNNTVQASQYSCTGH